MPLLRLRVLNCLPITLLAIAGAVPLVPARPTQASVVLPVQSNCQVAGPFATMRRANEVAAEARQRGYSAMAYHNGDGYYVRAC
jgi:hypothetical protein